MTHPLLIEDAASAIEFAMGGNARFTLVSKKTGERKTYRVRQPDATKPYFVQLLTGPDNTSDYTYLGYITGDFPGWVAKCGRVLTDPASIESGVGPECAKKAA